MVRKMKKSLWAPFIRLPDSMFTIMLDVLAVMVPLIIWGGYVYGPRSVLIVLLAMASAAVFDFAFTALVFRSFNLKDISSLITGGLIGLSLPVAVPLWAPVLGSLVAIVAAKSLFGGIGRNIFNPAAVGIVSLYALFGRTMNVFTKPFVYFPALTMTLPQSLVKGNRVVTALDSLKGGVVNTSAIMDDFYGLSPGTIGELSAFLLIIGFLYLVFKRVIRFNTAFAFSMTIIVLSYFFSYADCEPIDFIKLQMFTGPTMLFMVFFLNDYATTPVTGSGKVLFAVLLGGAIVAVRYFGPAHYGEYIVLLALNPLSPIIEKFTFPRVFGTKILTQARDSL